MLTHPLHRAKSNWQQIDRLNHSKVVVQRIAKWNGKDIPANFIHQMVRSSFFPIKWWDPYFLDHWQYFQGASHIHMKDLLKKREQLYKSWKISQLCSLLRPRKLPKRIEKLAVGRPRNIFISYYLIHKTFKNHTFIIWNWFILIHNGSRSSQKSFSLDPTSQKRNQCANANQRWALSLLIETRLYARGRISQKHKEWIDFHVDFCWFDFKNLPIGRSVIFPINE